MVALEGNCSVVPHAARLFYSIRVAQEAESLDRNRIIFGNWRRRTKVLTRKVDSWTAVDLLSIVPT